LMPRPPRTVGLVDRELSIAFMPLPENPPRLPIRFELPSIIILATIGPQSSVARGIASGLAIFINETTQGQETSGKLGVGQPSVTET
jgi:hypothetical protein